VIQTKKKQRLSQKGCQPEFAEGYRFDCQYFDKLNMTIKTIFENAFFLLPSCPDIFLMPFWQIFLHWNSNCYFAARSAGRQAI